MHTGIPKENAIVRVTPRLLDAESYGVRSGPADMIRFAELNIGAATVAREPPLKTQCKTGVASVMLLVGYIPVCMRIYPPRTRKILRCPA